MKQQNEDIARRIEIAAGAVNGECFSKAELAVIYNTAEITINRDLQWLRSEGLGIYSRKNQVVITDNKADTITRLTALYLSLDYYKSLYTPVKLFERSKATSHYLILLTKAIRENKFIKVNYCRLEDDHTSSYALQPDGLRLIGLNWILSAIKEGEDIIKNFYVSRINHLELLDKIFKTKSSAQNNKDHNIVLKFSSEVKSQVYDKLWFDNFEITEDEHGFILLKTKSPITTTLASWCLSWWDKIEIVEPVELKLKIKSMIDSFTTKNF